MSKLQKREKIMMLITIIIIISVSYVKWYLLPLIDENRRLGMKIEKTLAESKLVRNDIGNYISYKKQKENIENDEVDISKKIFNDNIKNVQFNIMDKINKESIKDNLKIKNKSINIEEIKKVGITKISFHILLEGEYENTITFLETFSYEKKMYIEALEIKKKTDILMTNIILIAYIKGGKR
ncbi:hypothetical protein [Haliovirga abyssi]|uniref:Type II secretion system protein M n=1 Tax=Haliovirga abyssi TaxID=2996794 RepID=A0AAU9E163_9FUSO|nr:hypothetical protein [Haliovirga abyssi]BDU51695.1 hypothetical protein HLVA_22640 [Haliovirga abyssi]